MQPLPEKESREFLQPPVEVKPVQPQSRPNLSESYGKWRETGQQTDFDQVMRALEPTVAKGINAYGGGRQELRTKARVLAADAVRSFNPDRDGRKAQLSTYVYANMQRLQRVAADRANAVRLPERSRMDAVVLRDAVREYVDKEGFEPDVKTLEELTGVSRSRQRLASDAFKEISEAGLETEKGDTLFRGEPDEKDDPWRDYVYFDLDPKSRKIFEWTTGYGGSKVLDKQEIAKRLKISPAAVSQRIQTIVRKLEARPADIG